MKIGSKYKFNEVQARHWEQFAFSSDINPTQTKKMIRDIAKTLPSMARNLCMDHRNGFAEQRIVKQIVALIEKRPELALTKLARS